MRARRAIQLCGIAYEHREILLRDKPQSMLDISPKGTVPVLITVTGQVIDESLEVMLWAIDQAQHSLKVTVADSLPWIEKNDTFFKVNLDRYKYPNRYPDVGSENDVRDKAYVQAETFLKELDAAIGQNNGFILSSEMSLADVALFPFIRQFSKVDEKKWDENTHLNLKCYLNKFTQSYDFKCIMNKYDLWVEGQEPLIITGQNL
jgi:glutathione S-transferase